LRGVWDDGRVSEIRPPLRETFESAADIYEAARPSYPERLFGGVRPSRSSVVDRSRQADLILCRPGDEVAADGVGEPTRRALHVPGVQRVVGFLRIRPFGLPRNAFVSGIRKERAHVVQPQRIPRHSEDRLHGAQSNARRVAR
jgi:hypothetical protein